MLRLIFLSLLLSTFQAKADHTSLKETALKKLSEIENNLSLLSNEIIKFRDEYAIPDVIPRERDRRLFSQDLTLLRENFFISKEQGILVALKELAEITKQIKEQSPEEEPTYQQVYLSGFFVASKPYRKSYESTAEWKLSCNNLESKLRILFPRATEEATFRCGKERYVSQYYDDTSEYKNINEWASYSEPDFSFKILVPPNKKMNVKYVSGPISRKPLVANFSSASTNSFLQNCLEAIEKSKLQLGDAFVAGDCGNDTVKIVMGTTKPPLVTHPYRDATLTSAGYRVFYWE